MFRRSCQATTFRLGQFPLSLAVRFQQRVSIPRQALPLFVNNRRSKTERIHVITRASTTTQISSFSAFTVLLLVACTGFALDLYLPATKRGTEQLPATEKVEIESVLAGPNLYPEFPGFGAMAVELGHIGNLTPDQETKLRQLWTATLKTFGVTSAAELQAEAKASVNLPQRNSLSPDHARKDKKRLSIFGKKNDRSDSGASTPSNLGDEEDKYGQVKEYHEILAKMTPEQLRQTFWTMVKSDHPDALLLRFLRARKWNVDRALVMLISTMNWRAREMHVDDDVVLKGEGGALEESKTGNGKVKQEADDFLAQLRKGKSFLHGTDREGRPCCFVRVRLHHASDQSQSSLERYTTFLIETTRLALRSPVETAVSPHLARRGT